MPPGYRPAAAEEPSPRDPREPAVHRAVPRRLLPGYWSLRLAGLSDAEAQPLLACKYGLCPADDQRQRFTLWELAHLEEVRERHRQAE